MESHFKSAKSSIFRFEGLQEYKVDQDDDIEALDSWLNLVKEMVDKGIVWQRVRYVEFPLTEYTKNELAFFKQTVLQGAEVRVCTEIIPEELRCNDFWLIDNEYILDMNYSKEGEFKGFKRSIIANQLLLKEWLLRNSLELSKVLRLESFLEIK